MIEKATVVSSRKDFAQVKIKYKEQLCNTCPVHSLCVGQKRTDGTITVLNSLSAQPGDEVKIEVPEGSYPKEMILLFAVLLLSALCGLILGYLSSFLLPLSPPLVSLIGFLLGLLSGGLFLFRYFRQINKKRLYPTIIDIIKKGGPHG